MIDTAANDYPDGFGDALYQQVLTLWVEPEIRHRGESRDPRSVRQVLVVMPPEGEVEVLIDEEADIVADFTSARPIAAGESVSADDIAELHRIRPLAAHPDAGWVLFVSVGASRYVAFDFRRNKAKARRLIDLARSYCALAAEAAASTGRLEPLLVNAYIAAELAVKAQMFVTGSAVDHKNREGGSIHKKREEWIARWADLGNAPLAHSSALSRLAELQAVARYGDGELLLTSQEAASLLEGVGNLISHAETAVAD